MNLSRGERFKDARIIHNKNGKQTQAEVYDATGIPASCIKDLEDDEIQRNVGYETIATLARHYGVSTDWLVGIANAPDISQTVRSVCEYTGLSSSTVNFLHYSQYDKSLISFYRKLFDSIIQGGQDGLDLIPKYVLEAGRSYIISKNKPKAHDSELYNTLAVFSRTENKYMVDAGDAEEYFLKRAEIELSKAMTDILSELEIEVIHELEVKEKIDDGFIWKVDNDDYEPWFMNEKVNNNGEYSED